MWVQSLGMEDPLEGRAWQPAPVFLPEEFHRQRSLAGYSPQGHKQLDTTEAAEHTRMHMQDYISGQITQNVSNVRKQGRNQ